MPPCGGVCGRAQVRRRRGQVCAGAGGRVRVRRGARPSFKVRRRHRAGRRVQSVQSIGAAGAGRRRVLAGGEGCGAGGSGRGAGWQGVRVSILYGMGGRGIGAALAGGECGAGRRRGWHPAGRVHRAGGAGHRGRRSPRAHRHRGGCLSYMVARQRRGRGRLAGRCRCSRAAGLSLLQGSSRGHRGRADLPGRRRSMPGTVAAAQFQPQTFQRHGCSRSRSRSSRTQKRQGGPRGLSCLPSVSRSRCRYHRGRAACSRPAPFVPCKPA